MEEEKSGIVACNCPIPNASVVMRNILGPRSSYLRCPIHENRAAIEDICRDINTNRMANFTQRHELVKHDLRADSVRDHTYRRTLAMSARYVLEFATQFEMISHLTYSEVRQALNRVFLWTGSSDQLVGYTPEFPMHLNSWVAPNAVPMLLRLVRDFYSGAQVNGEARMVRDEIESERVAGLELAQRRVNNVQALQARVERNRANRR
jgi:hypothetical protein